MPAPPALHVCIDDVAACMQEQYQDALNHLLIAEEAADLCSGDLLAVVDNLGIMLLDIVW